MKDLLVPEMDARTLEQLQTNAPAATNETAFDIAEEEHENDAMTALLINVTLIVCLLLAYYVKRFRIYSLPESAGALLVGIVVGGVARLFFNNLRLFEFSPELFFFVLLPPIIFEAGYSLNRKDFFQNIGAILLFAMFGTIVSTFVVGGLCFYFARLGIVPDVDSTNPMEALLFGALISSVDPVATLSIMGNAELRCDPLLYSLVFGESVLNDAVAISLFRVFGKYYNPDGPNLTQSEIPAALGSFVVTTILSVVMGVVLGLIPSFFFKHSSLSDYAHLETSLLFCFCYLCYASSEALGLSGIMSLFIQGMILSHYNSYNLSTTAHVASEHIFQTLATIAETIVFLYMGMDVSTGRFGKYDLLFSVEALIFCVVGRFLNVIPLSWVANLCRGTASSSREIRSQHNQDGRDETGGRKIPLSLQCVLWFAGLRGAVSYALSTNMPGPNREVYATATLFICIFTTVVGGGLTETVLTYFDAKVTTPIDEDSEGRPLQLNRLSYNPHARFQANSIDHFPLARRTRQHVYKGIKKFWKQLDDDVLKPYFGGDHPSAHLYSEQTNGDLASNRGTYELAFCEPRDCEEVDDNF